MVDDATAYISYQTGGALFIQKWTRSGSTWSYDSEFEVTGYTTPGTPNLATMDTDGTNLIVGIDGYDESGVGTDEGLVLVMSQTGVVSSEIYGAVNEEIGSAVTIDGDEAVIGVESYQDTNSNQGHVQVWDICI
jgi:hypothetical protein